MCTKLVSPHDFLLSHCRHQLRRQGWFSVPFVFQSVSNFCSDIRFKLQNINVGNWRSLLLRPDSGDSINHLNYHSSYVPRSRFPVSVIIDDLYFKISWRVSTSLKARQFGRVQWDSLKNKNRWNIHIQTTPLNSHARQRRGRRDWNISLSSMIFFRHDLSTLTGRGKVLCF